MTADSTAPYVLLAENNAQTREAFRHLFSKLGWRFDVAQPGQSIVEVACTKQYDVIITDIPMPGLPSADVLRILRSKNPLQAIVVVTADGNCADAVRLLQDNAIEALPRPINFDIVESSVVRVLRAARQSDDCNTAERFVSTEISEYAFTTQELSQLQFPLVVAERLEQAGLIDRKEKLQLDLAFQEALANSIEHGSLELESKWRELVDASGIDQFERLKADRLKESKYGGRLIKVRTHYIPGQIEISITDQGPGFTPTPTPKLPANELLSSGRGRALIERTMDEVRYENGGRTIVMVKRLNPMGK